MSIFVVSEKNYKRKITVNYITYVDKRLFKISSLLHVVPDGQKAERKPHTPSPKSGTAVQSYVYTSRLF